MKISTLSILVMPLVVAPSQTVGGSIESRLFLFDNSLIYSSAMSMNSSNHEIMKMFYVLCFMRKRGYIIHADSVEIQWRLERLLEVPLELQDISLLLTSFHTIMPNEEDHLSLTW